MTDVPIVKTGKQNLYLINARSFREYFKTCQVISFIILEQNQSDDLERYKAAHHSYMQKYWKTLPS